MLQSTDTAEGVRGIWCEIYFGKQLNLWMSKLKENSRFNSKWEKLFHLKCGALFILLPLLLPAFSLLKNLEIQRGIYCRSYLYHFASKRLFLPEMSLL